MPDRWRCPDCSAVFGAWLSGCPRCRSGRELVVALNECKGCTTVFAVGLPCCPHCRGTDFAEQGQDMPKITAHGGPTNAAEPGPELTAPTGAVIATSGAWADGPEPADAETAEEESSPGNSSETSSEMPSSGPEPSDTPSRSPAPTTGSRSAKGRTARRSARSTGGGQAADTSAADIADE